MHLQRARHWKLHPAARQEDVSRGGISDGPAEAHHCSSQDTTRGARAISDCRCGRRLDLQPQSPCARYRSGSSRWMPGADDAVRLVGNLVHWVMRRPVSARRLQYCAIRPRPWSSTTEVYPLFDLVIPEHLDGSSVIRYVQRAPRLWRGWSTRWCCGSCSTKKPNEYVSGRHLRDGRT